MTESQANLANASIAFNGKARIQLWFFLAAFLLMLVVGAIFGWTDAARILSGFGSFVPFLIGIGVIVYSGSRFSIRMMMIAIACFAVGLTLTLQPLLEYQRTRRVTRLLQDSQVTVMGNNPIAQHLEFDVHDLQPIEDKHPMRDHVPGWMALASKDVAKTLPSRKIKFISAHTGDQLRLVCNHVDSLPNLRILNVSSASSEDIDYFFDRLEKFKCLEVVSFWDCKLPDGELERVRHIPVLSFCSNVQSIQLNEEQLRTISSFSEIKSLSVQYMTDAELEILVGNQTLRRLWLERATVSQDLVHKFMDANPDCRVFRRMLNNGPDEILR